MTERLVQGIVDLCRRLRRPHMANYVRECSVDAPAFPAVASGATEGEIRSAIAAGRALHAQGVPTPHAIRYAHAVPRPGRLPVASQCT
eukprot:6701762-Pyramimonas_sp.AAC.1